MEESSFDTRKAIICFQYVERIKSELIIAVKLLEKLDELESDELAGAEKMMLSFLDALAGELDFDSVAARDTLESAMAIRTGLPSGHRPTSRKRDRAVGSATAPRARRE